MFKTSSRGLQDAFKKSWRRTTEDKLVLLTRLQDILKTPSIRFQDSFKTYLSKKIGLVNISSTSFGDIAETNICRKIHSGHTFWGIYDHSKNVLRVNSFECIRSIHGNFQKCFHNTLCNDCIFKKYNAFSVNKESVNKCILKNAFKLFIIPFVGCLRKY